MQVVIRSLVCGSNEIEVVEHKGIGHPDTICDGLAEAIGVALARHYLERFGSVLHFNVDKVLLVGGESKPAFGGGSILQPMQAILAGRATRLARGVRVPVDDIASSACKEWVRANMHALDADSQVTWDCRVHAGSPELVGLFLASAEKGGVWLANDTSIGAGYAPTSALERAVLAAAERLRRMCQEHPEVGEDVKVMGVKHGERADFTIACALIGKYLRSASEYVARRAEIARAVFETTQTVLGGRVDVQVNAADDDAAGRLYLTVTGTSAESGDDGEVGRGNRVNGLITPYRPMSLEAAAGKNPVSHVGKLYNVAAHRLAHALVQRVPLVASAECVLVSSIGRRVDDPALADVRLGLLDGCGIESVKGDVEGIVREHIAGIGSLVTDLLAGKIRLF
jgi:S-adenosylmethionine synthetase